MSSVVQLGSAQLLPIKAASEIVPYSRDYVARLAREGKIVAVYIDRQWFVDTTSLQNFYTNALLEESVRKRHLSLVRKHDLEVKEVYRNRLEVVIDKKSKRTVATVVHAGMVVGFGLMAGMLLVTTGSYLTNERLQHLAQIPSAGLFSYFSSSPITNPVGDVIHFSDFTVIETDTALSLQNGIVLVPRFSASTTESVADFFSDPVTVEIISTTTGIIRSQNVAAAVTEMPFVRVPVAAVLTTTTPQVAIP